MRGTYMSGEASRLLLFAIRNHEFFEDAMLDALAERLAKLGYSFSVDRENARIDVREPEDEDRYEEFFSGLEDAVERIVRDVAYRVVDRGCRGYHSIIHARIREDDVFVERELVEGGDTEFHVYERGVAALTESLLGEPVPIITVHMCFDCCAIIILTAYDWIMYYL